MHTCRRQDFVAEIIDVTVMNVPTQSVFGWMVIMTRNGTDYDWNLSWNQFKNGFSLSKTDFWLGLERIREMTSTGGYKLRIEMYIVNSNLNFIGWKSVEYRSVLVDSESAGYMLTVDG